jgi:TRAP-type transport system small permease protein
VTRAIYAVNKALHYVAGTLLLGVVVITVYNVLGRWLFGAPFRGTVELTQLAMVGVVYLGMAYAQHRDSHITVNLLYLRLGPRWQAVLDAFAAIVGIAVVSLIAWRLYVYADVLESGGRTTASRSIPLHPFAYVAIVGLVAYVLALATTLVQRARDATRPEPPPDTTDPVEQATL